MVTAATKLTLREIAASQSHRSWTSYIFKRLSIPIVYLLQGLPLTPNVITVFSFALVLAGLAALVIFGSPLWCIILLMLSFSFDQVDGIWARIKKQESEFGGFFDSYTDEIKDHLIDLAFALYYFSRLQELVPNLTLLVGLIALLLILKGSYYAARDSEPRWTDHTRDMKKLHIFSYGGAEKFMFVYPLLAINFWFFVFYAAAHLFVYPNGIVRSLLNKRRRLK